MNDGVVCLGTRIEVAKRLRLAYRGASKKEKGRVLDNFCEVTGLSRASARRYLTSDVVGNPGVVRIDYRTVRPTKYSASSKKALERVWVASGCQCGKYLAASMRVLLDSLQAHGELVLGKDGYRRVSDCLCAGGLVYKYSANRLGYATASWLMACFQPLVLAPSI